MDLLSTFSELQKTSIPNLLVIAGILFLLLSFAGELGAIIKLPKDKQKPIGAIGVALLVFGVGMYLTPFTPTSVNPPETIAAKLLAESQNWENVANTGFDTDTWSKDFNEESWDGNATITSSGTYLVTMNYIGESSSEAYWIFPVLEEVSDFYLSVEGKYIAGNDDNTYGLLFRLNGTGRPGYLFRLYEKKQMYDIQFVGDDFVPLKEETLSPTITQGKFNKIAVIAKGSDFYFFINDKFVEHISDNQRPKGSVALRIAVDKGTEHIFEFDNFVLRTPPK